MSVFSTLYWIHPPFHHICPFLSILTIVSYFRVSVLPAEILVIVPGTFTYSFHSPQPILSRIYFTIYTLLWIHLIKTSLLSSYSITWTPAEVLVWATGLAPGQLYGHMVCVVTQDLNWEGPYDWFHVLLSLPWNS